MAWIWLGTIGGLLTSLHPVYLCCWALRLLRQCLFHSLKGILIPLSFFCFTSPDLTRAHWFPCVQGPWSHIETDGVKEEGRRHQSCSLHSWQTQMKNGSISAAFSQLCYFSHQHFEKMIRFSAEMTFRDKQLESGRTLTANLEILGLKYNTRYMWLNQLCNSI